jgi:hypothetical protein
LQKEKGCKFSPCLTPFKELSPHHYLKLLDRVFSERLTKFSDAFLLLNENQCSFQRGYSAVDNLFIIHSLFEILKFKKKKIFCAFIHFEKAFDTLRSLIYIAKRKGLQVFSLSHTITTRKII